MESSIARPGALALLKLLMVAALVFGSNARKSAHRSHRPASMTSKEAMRRLRINSQPADVEAALTRLDRLLPVIRPMGGAATDIIGQAANSKCSSGGAQPAIIGLWSDEDLMHDALVVECSRPGGKSPTLFLAVVSEASAAGASRRADVRRTWGSRRGLALAFFLGQSDSSALQAAVDDESRRYRDLVQFRATVKGSARHLATLEWCLAHCPGVRYMVRLDDTVFVDVAHLTTYLSASPPPGILCSVRHNVVPQRSRSSPWYVDWKTFQGRRYPDYCDTAAYIMDRDTALKLLACATVRRPVWIGDVHVTGILREAAGIHLEDFPRGHGNGLLLPRDSSGSSSSSLDYIFMRSHHPQFNSLYWPGLWRGLMLRECSVMAPAL